MVQIFTNTINFIGNFHHFPEPLDKMPLRHKSRVAMENISDSNLKAKFTKTK